MENSERRFAGARVLLAVAALFVVIAGLKSAQAILIPFLLAFFLAIIGSVPMYWLQSRRVPTGLCVLVVTLFMVGVLVALVVLLASSVEEFTIAAPHYSERLNELALSFLEWLKSYGLDLPREALFATPQAGTVMDYFGKGLRGLVSTASSTVMIIIIMVFMLLEAAEFRAKVRSALDQAFDTRRLLEVTIDVQRYLGIKTVMSALTGILVFLWVEVMGVEFSILWGIVAFILNFIPFVGSIIASVPALLLTLTEAGVGPTATLGLGYIAINVGVSNFLEPIFMGRRLGLSPLVVFLSLVFWGWVWGPAGMLLSVPLTMVVKILLEHSEDFRWVALILVIVTKSSVSRILPLKVTL